MLPYDKPLKSVMAKCPVMNDIPITVFTSAADTYLGL